MDDGGGILWRAGGAMEGTRGRRSALWRGRAGGAMEVTRGRRCGGGVRAAGGERTWWGLIGSAVRHPDGTVPASVEPRKLPAGHPLLAASGVTNAITFDTDVLGGVTISGPGAGREETAFAILSDLIELADRIGAASHEVAA